MLSKSQIKLIKSLAQKKYRAQHGLFTVEGVKGITEFINSSFKLQHIYTTEAVFNIAESELSIISGTHLNRISQLKNPNTAVGVFEIPISKPIDTSQLIVALDDVRDPGNLGTIIRLCDWFGIKDLVCSKATVDCYNSKVVQATMGSLTRVNVSYVDLDTFLSESNSEIFGTFMDGENIYKANLPENGIVVMGNEANGISKPIENLVSKRLAIPRFGNLKATESLNVATATSVCLSEFKRATI
ncbi:MAG: RNA methyltransferase [Winogradskyella sp.]|uniref:TrmH family RNA methyltransferase n=1 Tax=Winogradskyella sp. TaxID=1883156 RepID=UPI00181EC18A|nr:RNA methyltransferase [Winogradskyella sp.]MBT8244651.1 RNA methyltransferase [Winogradskyella sp.]NNK23139.1 RNA methyltransferase [Winogradskyella sp.]